MVLRLPSQGESEIANSLLIDAQTFADLTLLLGCNHGAKIADFGTSYSQF